MDSRFCHAGWAESLGGISFPLLADFHPKGAVAQSYGLFLADRGITDRATVIIDAVGVVRHASSVTPAGERNIEELAGLCESVDKKYAGDLDDFPTPPGLMEEATLYVKSNCGFSRWALQARENLHLRDRLPVKNITEDAAARIELEKLTGRLQAPCLVIGGRPVHESTEIVQYLASQVTDIPAPAT